MRRVLALALLTVAAVTARVLWGRLIVDQPYRLLGGLLLDCALVALAVLLFRLNMDMRRRSPDAWRASGVAAGRLDSRHLGLALAGASSFAGGPLAAGAPSAFVGICALIGTALFGLIGLRAVPAWADPKWESWVGGVMFTAVAVVAFAVTLSIRLAG